MSDVNAVLKWAGTTFSDGINKYILSSVSGLYGFSGNLIVTVLRIFTLQFLGLKFTETG
jgi:hypothetical protein